MTGDHHFLDPVIPLRSGFAEILWKNLATPPQVIVEFPDNDHGVIDILTGRNYLYRPAFLSGHADPIQPNTLGIVEKAVKILTGEIQSSIEWHGVILSKSVPFVKIFLYTIPTGEKFPQNLTEPRDPYRNARGRGINIKYTRKFKGNFSHI
jgi:hypothetical protein